MMFASQAILPLSEDVLIDFPNVFTDEWQGFTVHVVNGFHVFRGGTAFGWTITLARLPMSQPDAFVLPQTLPAVAPIVSDGGVVASVTLPEAGGYAQYWVPVLERYKTAVLQSREWTVIFQKSPKPVATV